MNPAPNLILVGPMGAGKSCIGRRLAERYGLRLADADRESLIVLTRDHKLAGVVAAHAPARGGWSDADVVEQAA